MKLFAAALLLGYTAAKDENDAFFVARGEVTNDCLNEEGALYEVDERGD